MLCWWEKQALSKQQIPKTFFNAIFRYYEIVCNLVYYLPSPLKISFQCGTFVLLDEVYWHSRKYSLCTKFHFCFYGGLTITINSVQNILEWYASFKSKPSVHSDTEKKWIRFLAILPDLDFRLHFPNFITLLAHSFRISFGRTKYELVPVIWKNTNDSCRPILYITVTVFKLCVVLQNGCVRLYNENGSVWGRLLMMITISLLICVFCIEML